MTYIQLLRIKRIVKSLNANISKGPDGIPVKLIKLSANVVDNHLTSIINHDILRSYFCSLVRTTYKKKDRRNKENYHPAGILDEFSKVKQVCK